MKKMIIAILIITSSCVGTRTHNYNNGPSTQIDYYVSENTKKLDFPFSDATIVNNVIYVSGQVGNIPGSNELVKGGIKEETRQTMKNIEGVLTSLGSSMEKVFKCTCMLSDISEWGEMSEEYRKVFNDNKKPSRSAFAGTGLALGAKVEIECWAVK
ncbi:RidA family protein [Flavobacteriaceae bacterium]|nr:RidA family protein [Flavobacteriaceae bacterium]